MLRAVSRSVRLTTGRPLIRRRMSSDIVSAHSMASRRRLWASARDIRTPMSRVLLVCPGIMLPHPRDVLRACACRRRRCGSSLGSRSSGSSSRNPGVASHAALKSAVDAWFDGVRKGQVGQHGDRQAAVSHSECRVGRSRGVQYQRKRLSSGGRDRLRQAHRVDQVARYPCGIRRDRCEDSRL